jgi:hypothetical protein
LYFSSGVVAWWALLVMIAWHVPAFTDAQQTPVGRQRALRHAANALNPDEPILDDLRTMKPSWSMWVKSITDGAGSSPRSVAITLPSRSVRLRNPIAESRARISFATRSSWPDRPGSSASKGFKIIAACPCARGSGPVHEVLGAVGSTAFQVSPSIFSAEPTTQPSAIRKHIGHRVVLDPGIGQHRRVGQRLS